jgi:hypothetical protein
MMFLNFQAPVSALLMISSAMFINICNVSSKTDSNVSSEMLQCAMESGNTAKEESGSKKRRLGKIYLINLF